MSDWSFILVAVTRTKRASPAVHHMYYFSSLVHRFNYNLTSLQRQEEVILAELRLYVLISNPPGGDKVVFPISIYERSADPRLGQRLIAYKKVSRNESGWEAFLITEAVNRWTKSWTFSISIEVQIDGLSSKAHAVSKQALRGIVNVDIVTSNADEHCPLLIIFSDEHRKKKLHAKEIQELIHHELSSISESKEVFKEFLLAYGSNQDPSPLPEHGPHEKAVKVTPHGSDDLVTMPNETMLKEKAYMKVLAHYHKVTSKDHGLGYKDYTPKQFRMKRSLPVKKSRGGRRAACKRNPLYVDFRSINWDKWIIAPRGYQV